MGEGVHCGAAIADGHVFAASDAGRIVALESATGQKRWEFDTGAPVRCSPAAVGGMIYCGSDSSRFHALDADTGQEKWSFHCGGPVQASPAVVGGVVLLGANDHHVYALDRHTGRKLWSHRMPHHSIQASPAVHGRQVFVGSWHDWVVALDLLTGQEQWRSFVPVSIEAVAFHGGKLYARSPNYLVEMDPVSGRRLRVGTLSYGRGGLGFLGDLAFHSGIRSQYGGSGAAVMNLADAGQKLKTPIPGLEDIHVIRATGLKGSSSLTSMMAPLVLGSTIAFATTAGQVVITDPQGERLWSFDLGGKCHSQPVAAGGVLVVGCDDGHIHAFREPSRRDARD
jgi:outer membrane protein assembly factor BamB